MRRRPDTALIDLARKGSRDAAEVLFDRYWTHAWRAAYAVTADRSLADDAAQEAIQKAFGSLDRFDETRPFGPWLKRIAVNRAIDQLRTRQLGERTDAQVFVVLDSSRSMLGSPERGAPSRFERAREIAHELIAQLPEIPVGVASLTDTLLPHLFPTTDRRVLPETLDKA